jgi:hypothetical protein
MRYFLALLLAVSSVAAYHGGLTYNDYGAHYGTYNYGPYYEPYYRDNWYNPGYGNYYYAERYHQRTRYNEVYNRIDGNYPYPRYTYPRSYYDYRGW